MENELKVAIAAKFDVEQRVDRIINESKGGLEAALNKFNIPGDLTPETVVKAYKKHGKEFVSEWFPAIEEAFMTKPLSVSFFNSDNSNPSNSNDFPAIIPNEFEFDEETTSKKFWLDDVNSLLGNLSGVFDRVEGLVSKKSTSDPITDAINESSVDLDVDIPEESGFDVTNTLKVVGVIIGVLLVGFVLVKVIKKAKKKKG